MNDDKELLTADQALERLPDSNTIHTFRQGGPVLIGCDWDRAEIIEAIQKAEEIQVPGQTACSMGHGLGIINHGSWLFIQTKPVAKSNE